MKHLRTTKEFRDVLTTANRLRSGNISLCVKEKTKEKGLAAGLIVSKKEVPLAVNRNYIRRIIYAFLREKEKEAKKGAEIIVKVKRPMPGGKRKVFLEIRSELEKALAKSGII